MNGFPDIHTHTVGGTDGFHIISCPLEGFSPCAGQWYSVGLHPWGLQSEVSRETWARLQEVLFHPQVLAVGEAGLDKLAAASMDLQEAVFVRQAVLADEVGKPLIIHLVKATDALLRLRKRLAPRVPWIIHGFRGKAQLACELLRHDFYLSFGAKFQGEALRVVPLSRLFIETDESPLPITEVYRLAASARQMSTMALLKAVRANVQSVFFP